MPGPVVLVVDDFRDGRELVAELLEFHGYRTLQARDGAEAVRLAVEHRPDMIIMDLCLPVIDGFEATRLIRHDPRTARTPIIAITGHATDAVLARALEAGCLRAFVKPCDPERLVRAVREAMVAAA
jgi:two-component system cell cycle response regulator DivK